MKNKKAKGGFGKFLFIVLLIWVALGLYYHYNGDNLTGNFLLDVLIGPFRLWGAQIH